MMKRVCGIVMALALCLTLLPEMASAAGPTRTEALDLRDYTVMTEPAGEGWKWEPNSGGGTLTLTDFHLLVDDKNSRSLRPLRLPTGKIDIVLNGANVLENTGTSMDAVIYGDGRTADGAGTDVTIKGSGSLEFRNDYTGSTMAYGLVAKSVTIESGTITSNINFCILSQEFRMKGGSLSIAFNHSDSGIYSTLGHINIDGGELNIDIPNGDAGIWITDPPDVGDGKVEEVNIRGGIVNINSGFIGIYLEARSDGSTRYMNVTGGVLNVKNNLTGYSAIHMPDGSLTVSGGVVITSSIRGEETGRRNSIVIVGDTGQAYGTAVVDQDIVIPQGANVLIPEDASVSVEDGVSVTNHGKIYVDGTLSGTVTGGDVYYGVKVNMGTAEGDGVTYLDKLYYEAGTEITLTADDREEEFLGWQVDRGDVTISGEGETTVQFTMPDAAVEVTAKFDIPDSPPSPPVQPVQPSGGSSSGGSSESGGSSGGSSDRDSGSPEAPSLPVTTTGQNNASTPTQTTASPSVFAREGTASVRISADVAAEILRQAEENKSETVAIAPKISGSAARTEVSIPASVLQELNRKTGADLTVSTPVADVVIPNGGLNTLADGGGTVTVIEEKARNTVELTLTADGRIVDAVPGGVTLTVTVPDAASGTVAALIHEDGTREIIRKSIVRNGSLTVPLEGSARIEILNNGGSFADVPSDSWAVDAVAFVTARQLFNGTSVTTFSPDSAMTRAMLAMVLHNLEGNPASETTLAFTDVSENAWYAGAVAWAEASGIVTGYTDGTFSPGGKVTREQLAVVLWRHAGCPAPSSRVLDFSDADQAGEYARDALCWAVECGVMNGKGGGVLDPKGIATRAQVAQMLKNYLENV